MLDSEDNCRNKLILNCLQTQNEKSTCAFGEERKYKRTRVGCANYFESSKTDNINLFSEKSTNVKVLDDDKHGKKCLFY